MKLERKELISQLEKLGDIFPDMRFGQLVSYVATLAKGPTQSAVYDVTDQEMVAAAIKNIQDNKNKSL